MNEKQEKALLEAVDALIRLEWARGAESQKACEQSFDRKARAYLASLEPKPEPKRGVEEILISAHDDMVGSMQQSWPVRAPAWTEAIREALRLYREERERVEKVADEIERDGRYAWWANRLRERRDG